MLNWLKSILGSAIPRRQPHPSDDAAPTEKDGQSATDQPDDMARLAVFGEIGGARPEKENRARSWWGGNFLGARDEAIPICQATGRAMHPILQVRVDELPTTPPAFEGLALVSLWMDLDTAEFWDSTNGRGFEIREYASLDGLVPLGCGFGESAQLPTFPVFWPATEPEEPSWEDTGVNRPMGSEYETTFDDLRHRYPIKLGGWPAWIQGSNWPADAEYLFQVDTTDKGKLCFGDAGSIYLFRTAGSWEIRGDCY